MAGLRLHGNQTSEAGFEHRGLDTALSLRTSPQLPPGYLRSIWGGRSLSSCPLRPLLLAFLFYLHSFQSMASHSNERTWGVRTWEKRKVWGRRAAQVTLLDSGPAPDPRAPFQGEWHVECLCPHPATVNKESMKQAEENSEVCTESPV